SETARQSRKPTRCAARSPDPRGRTGQENLAQHLHEHTLERLRAAARKGVPGLDDERRPQQPELSADELADEEAAELPDREAMSLINLNAAAPINAAVALNVLSDGSTAYANAEQTGDIPQRT